jgi:hypothetical protein
MSPAGGRPSLRDRFIFAQDPSSLEEHPPLHSVLFEVEEREGAREGTLKLWRKTGRAIDEDLRALWLHEVRQVERMMAYDGARKVIVGLEELVEDDEFFGMLLEPAGRSLDVLVSEVPRQHWLRNLDGRRQRRLLWENVHRLVEALRILHAQGLVHGRLDKRAVVSEGAEQPDFLLSGFEWSLRLSAEADRSHAPLAGRASTRRPRSYSFTDDWARLGDLIADLLGVHVRRSGEVASDPDSPAMPLTLAERALLKRLVAPSKGQGVDADAVGAAIRDILSSVPQGSDIQSGTFILVFDSKSGLEQAVYDVTDRLVEMDARDAQLDWVRADLGARVTLLSPRGFDPVQHSLRLVTTAMVYELRAFHDNGTPVWDIAVCKAMRPRSPQLARTSDTEHTIESPIEVATGFRRATELRARHGAGVLDWSAFAQRHLPSEPGSSGRVRLALILVQAIEAVLEALEVYPVELVRTDRREGVSIASIRPRMDSERDRFAAKIGLLDTPRTLAGLFEEERPDADAPWTLSRSVSLGGRSQDDVSALFLSVASEGGVSTYEFETAFEPNPSARYYLRPTGEPGTEQVIRRRLRMIAALEARVDLADLLEDPWRARRAGHEPLVEDGPFQNLDGPKQDALKLLWKTLPVFFVVGPPGVGKIMLATEVLRRKFAAERSARVLLSAQGHDALEHLRTEVKKALAAAGLGDLLVVRSATDERPSEDGADVAAGSYLEAFAKSELARQVPSTLRRRLELLAAPRTVNRGSSSQEDQTSLRAMANLVRDAANIVMATANSADIERLVEAREQFDWVIVEEAAKATGPELVGSLMLSGRRLLIGDHRQLPAFDADRLTKILADDSLVSEAIDMAVVVAESLVGEDDLEALATLEPSARRRTADLALRLVEPFRTFVEDDERRTRRDGVRPMSKALSEQRRMDPAIAEIVSRSFYGGDLRTQADRQARAQSEAPPLSCIEPLPPSPVVVVDFPHVSSTGKAAPMEVRPRWHNPAEIEAIVQVLRRIRARPEAARPPTLAVLSPYRAQTQRLEARIDQLRDNSLAHLSDFSTVRPGLGFVGTVDSFQGSEADIVIVSLVRNNPRTGMRGLGFLRDPRRMNVLLSRAKWQLVLVGSLAFLREAVSGRYSAGVGELGFLAKMLETIDRLCNEKRGGTLPLARVLPVGALGGAL